MPKTAEGKIQVVEVLSNLDDVVIIEEALAALGYCPSSYSNKETQVGTTYVLAESMAQAEEWREAIETGLKDWKDCLSGSVEVRCEELLEEDWSTSWKKNFHTFRASERLVIKPSWEDYQPQPGDLVLALDPGMCFGTGYHGTTKACLQFMDELERQQGPVSFLDAGCGSGILSMGAWLLGYRPVYAFDNDPQCIPTTLENMALCGISGVDVSVADLASYNGPKAKLVAANILAVVLLANAERVVSYVERPGYLLLSGILIEQYDDILRRFTALGLKEVSRKTIDEWRSGCFRVE
ncbi:MAG: 50S ribosomal protein L11 methyltransferase [Victivallales bacterium]|nr:50S ribosomal protein L11 methyltransferase [Victivallales bacterium]